ncbi:PREDICTED: uncharacterized protein LOC101310190 [Fragaria vesca subsp. vesca]|uniref:uncharacterized protein LOC101310190 n=1 Tax=Fragaria vesca subsp. vesca TaxID=101020 RepID=UPI0002C34137|nr:PREDICTED: uncharacterized protein LOC101310190 [Fragaria vesca subsp. vesca]
MMKWSPWPGGSTRRFHVKVNQLKLHGFSCENERDKALFIEVKWKGSKKHGGPSGVLMAPFYGRSRCQKNYTGKGFPGKGEIVEWDDEFQSLCSFGLKQSGGSFSPWDLTFTLLHGESAESKTVLGKVSMNLAEKASKMEAEIHTRLSVNLNLEGMIIPIEATLLVCLSFAEVRNAQDSAGIVDDSAESDKDRMVRGVSYFRSFRKTNKEKKSSGERFTSSDTDESCLTDSDGASGNETSQTELGSSPSSETSQVDSGQKSWFSKKRKWFSPRPPRRKVEPLIERTTEVNGDPIANDNHLSDSTQVLATVEHSLQSYQQDGNSITSNSWEVREVSSRDGQAKLKTNVFFASFDQRSEKAAGESACSTVVAVIAHWLHSNQGSMPTTSEYDNLITQGSSEWQNLCSNEVYMNLFPNKHFDLETVLEADLRPLEVVTEKSFIGFFSPEKFESLKGHMSFDQIWNEISKNTIFDEPRIYIVSWNDHFFVLKVEADAYYIIDSLGERLFEGCNQAYMLKFDESSIISKGNLEKTEAAASKEMGGSESNEESSEVICSGKECCREFIKRFLAAVPLKQLAEEEKKKTVSDLILHQRLQIEFHYSYSPSSSLTSSVTSSSHSLF